MRFFISWRRLKKGYDSGRKSNRCAGFTMQILRHTKQIKLKFDLIQQPLVIKKKKNVPPDHFSRENFKLGKFQKLVSSKTMSPLADSLNLFIWKFLTYFISEAFRESWLWTQRTRLFLKKCKFWEALLPTSHRASQPFLPPQWRAKNSHASLSSHHCWHQIAQSPVRNQYCTPVQVSLWYNAYDSGNTSLKKTYE